MWSTVLEILKPPQVITPSSSEKPDYSLVIVGTVALLVVLIVVVSIFKKN